VMKCSLCGAEISPGEMFCGECGHPVQVSVGPPTPAQVRTCPKCSSIVDAGERFCGSCGYDLTGTTAKPQSATSRPAVTAGPQAAARTSSNSFRIALIVGLVAMVAIVLLTIAGVGLWVWLGPDSNETNTTPSATTTGPAANANIGKINVSIAGTWNCEFRSSTDIARGQMVLRQNGSAVTGTVATENGGTDEIAGTFDGQEFSFRVPNTQVGWQLALSSEGFTMKGEAQWRDDKGTLQCSR
jgi:hypothetical protein